MQENARKNMMRNGLLYLGQSTSYDFENVPQSGTSHFLALFKKFYLGYTGWGGDQSAIERLETRKFTKHPKMLTFDVTHS